jgi:hypothetical protein
LDPKIRKPFGSKDTKTFWIQNYENLTHCSHTPTPTTKVQVERALNHEQSAASIVPPTAAAATHHGRHATSTSNAAWYDDDATASSWNDDAAAAVDRSVDGLSAAAAASRRPPAGRCPNANSTAHASTATSTRGYCWQQRWWDDATSAANSTSPWC